MASQFLYTNNESNSKSNTLYYGGVTINHEGKKLDNEGEKASCANSPPHVSGVEL